MTRHLRMLEQENSREVRRAKPLRLSDVRTIESYVDMRSAADFLFLLVIRGAYENGVRLGNLLKYAYVDGVTWLTDGSVHLVLDLTKTSAGNSVRLHYHDTGCDWCFCKLLRRHFVAYKLDSMQGDFYLFPTIKIRCRSRLKTMPVDFAHFLSTKWVNNRFTLDTGCAHPVIVPDVSHLDAGTFYEDASAAPLRAFDGHYVHPSLEARTTADFDRWE